MCKLPCRNTHWNTPLTKVLQLSHRIHLASLYLIQSFTNIKIASPQLLIKQTLDVEQVRTLVYSSQLSQLCNIPVLSYEFGKRHSSKRKTDSDIMSNKICWLDPIFHLENNAPLHTKASRRQYSIKQVRLLPFSCATSSHLCQERLFYRLL